MQTKLLLEEDNPLPRSSRLKAMKNKMLQLKLERRGENGAVAERSADSDAKISGESLDINANVVNRDVVSPAPPGPCFFCGQQTELLCRFCQGVYYCSQEHFNIHRSAQLDYCYPFIVKTDPEAGRYCVASRDIAPCEVILREEPAVLGPYTPTSPLCLTCYAGVDLSYLCPTCNLPMCDDVCSRSEVHKLVKDGAQNVENLIGKLSGIMLLTKTHNPSIYKRILNLMDHSEERQAEATYLCASMKVNVMTFLVKQFGCVEYSEAEIDRCIGILKTNGMKLEHGRLKASSGVVLYPIYCLINSACVSNTNHIKTDTQELQVRAQVGIKAGEEISTRYVSSTLGNNRRRQYLSKFWYFNCNCARCSDSTEFATHMSSVRCLSCREGLLVKTDALTSSSPWRCQSCRSLVQTQLVEEQVDALEDQMNQLDMTDIDSIEEMIFHLLKDTILHPQHYIVIELSHSLIFAYNKKSLSRPEMDRKVQLCQQVLAVLGTVDPGFTSWRGKLLNELSNTVLLISRTDYSAGAISLTTFKRRIYNSMKNMATAKKCINAGFSISS